MNKSIWGNAGTICGLCCGLALFGCAVAPDQRHYVDGVVMVAPPTPQQEIIGEPPVAGEVWLAGYWNWTGARYEWTATPTAMNNLRTSLLPCFCAIRVPITLPTPLQSPSPNPSPQSTCPCHPK
jgi:hypothetical protein